MKFAFSTKNVNANSFLEYCNITSQYGFHGLEIFDAFEEKKSHEDSIFHSATVNSSKRKLVNRHIGISAISFPEKIFKSSEINEVQDFINTYPANYYAIRDKSKASGVFKLKVEPQNILNEVVGYDLFSINVSSYNYIDNQLLVGEIFVSNTSVNAILSTNSGYSVRDAIKNPDFNIMTNIFDDKTLNQIPCFDEVYKYIIDNKLQNTIVEFAYFDKPIGINKENIIIYELRTDY